MGKREQILETTLNLISEIGFQSTSISLIIQKSNTAAGTIYHYFKSKEDLIDTLYNELRKEMGQAIIRNIDQPLTYKEKFFLIWTNLFTFYINNPRKFEFLEDYANSPLIRKEIKVINQRHYQSAIDFIESGIQLGTLRNLPVQVIINLFFGNISTYTRMILLEEIEPTNDLLEKIIQSSWDSIKIN